MTDPDETVNIVGEISAALREHQAEDATGRSPDEASRDEANIVVRGALNRMGRAAGAAFTEQPIFEGARTTEQVMDPAASIRMGLMLRNAVDLQLHTSIRRARAAGLSWAQIGDALGLEADQARGISLAEVAYEYATDAEHARPFDRLSFYYTCAACGQHVTDRGPYEAHPLDNEEGHADSCTRMAAAIAEHDARWGEEG
jgi:hypothetical protein